MNAQHPIFVLIVAILITTQALAAEKIVFIRIINGDVPKTYLMEPDGSQQTRLINDETPEHGPAGSPDGRMIAIVREHDNASSSIFLVDVDGTNLRNITNLPAWYLSPQ
ncbi:MAG: hypothetical protein O3A46_04435 [Candidatus Poribacteria bacterium]|nr:hypothetical protein [Candidatus Poribacteria bacterium]